jgi:hypothetical protein
MSMIEPLIITLLGSALGPITKAAAKRASREVRRTRTRSRLEPGQRVLVGFAVIVLAFGAVTVVRFWPEIKRNENLFYYGGWLFLVMLFGMFVQVIAANYRSGKPLFEVTASQLIFPVLFSIIVFYGVWVTASSAQGGLFPIYAAFLNGYFWESVVSATKPPSPPEPPKPLGSSHDAAGPRPR